MTKSKNFFSGFRKRSPAADAASDRTGDARAATPDASPAAPAAENRSAAALKQGFFARLASGLSRTSQRLSDGVAALVAKKRLDNETLDALEELLIGADLGVAAAARVRAALETERFDKEVSESEVREALADVVAATLIARQRPLIIDAARRPHVILVVGVNGSGKTTTIGKLAARFRAASLRVVLAAGDTFRAAAADQLKIWGERTGADVVAKPPGSDAAGLAFEALEKARREAADVLLIDTAGRLQNRRELMDELAKIVRVIKKIAPDAPHDTLLVLDATVGQNALSQAGAFREIAGVTGLIMTKLDGTARGGILVALAERHDLPIHFVGVGEAADDLQPFDAQAFARALAGLSSLADQSRRPSR
jgi:fused signal recognition particle receptor